MSILGQFGLWLLGLTIGGTLMASLGTMALGVGVALAMAPTVPWG